MQKKITECRHQEAIRAQAGMLLPGPEHLKKKKGIRRTH
jgi:hypothetical protein